MTTAKWSDTEVIHLADAWSTPTGIVLVKGGELWMPFVSVGWLTTDHALTLEDRVMEARTQLAAVREGGLA